MLDPIAGRLERYLDVLSARQRAGASNIANADTPGYKAKDVDFQAALDSAAAEPVSLVDVPGLRIKNDGNNVSLDREARMLSENAIRFQVASQLISHQFRATRTAIKEGQG